jgi:hypothetical protein
MKLEQGEGVSTLRLLLQSADRVLTIGFTRCRRRIGRCPGCGSSPTTPKSGVGAALRRDPGCPWQRLHRSGRPRRTSRLPGPSPAGQGRPRPGRGGSAAGHDDRSGRGGGGPDERARCRMVLRDTCGRGLSKVSGPAAPPVTCLNAPALGHQRLGGAVRAAIRPPYSSDGLALLAGALAIARTGLRSTSCGRRSVSRAARSC